MGGITVQVTWTCDPPPESVAGSWEFYWNGNLVASDSISVPWSGNTGVLELSPSYTPDFEASDAGDNSVEIVVTLDGDNERRCQVPFTVEVIQPSD